MFLRRQAIQIVAQLPDDRDQALEVLDYARELYDSFLRPVDLDRAALVPDLVPELEIESTGERCLRLVKS